MAGPNPGLGAAEGHGPLGTVIIGLAFLLFLPWAGGVGPTTPLLAVAVILLVFALIRRLMAGVR